MERGQTSNSVFYLYVGVILLILVLIFGSGMAADPESAEEFMIEELGYQSAEVIDKHGPFGAVYRCPKGSTYSFTVRVESSQFDFLVCDGPFVSRKAVALN